MKEIDINIEGYNVNGICVGCLNYKRKMFYVEEVKDCFKLIADIDVPDGLTIQVCWECFAAARTVMRFRKQIVDAYNILIDYSAKNPFLSSPTDFTRHASTNLSIAEFDTVTIDPEDTKNDPEDTKDDPEETKDEVEVKSEPEGEDYDVKEEAAVKTKDELPEVDVQFEGFAPEDHASSEDDVQLSKLKEKKERRDRKRRKKTEKEVKQRKQKPLPEGMEVYTMTEEEMWTLRAEEIMRPEFLRHKYRCPDCLLTFNTEKLMNEHILSKHRLKHSRCHKCDVCNSYFLGKEHLATHRAWHYAAYRCHCGYRTCVLRRARQHALQHQGDVRHQCADCGKSFSSRSTLSYHRNKQHKEKLQCDCCGKVFASKMTLKYHLKSLTQGKEDKPPEKLYIPCKGCNKVFNSKKSYRAHVVIHNGLTYPCPICGKQFQWKRNLARHTRNHRERDAGATHECRACGKTFASRDCYNNHMRLSKRHVSEDAYVHACNYCGKKFATKYCMVDHIDWDHLKRIKYQCNVCFKAFKTSKIMVSHVNNIHGGKSKEPDGQHLCDVCGKSYKSEKRLKGHVWSMHTTRSSAKVFKCKLCPATFAWQTSIYKHARMMHDAKRPKQTRTQPVKKQEPYPDIELANRMQYFQQNIVPNITHAVQPIPVGIVQNIV